MKITKNQLKQIIKEELDTVVQEYGAGGALADVGRGTGIYKGIQRMKGNAGKQLLKDEELMANALAEIWHQVSRHPDHSGGYTGGTEEQNAKTNARARKSAEKNIPIAVKRAMSVRADAIAKEEAGIYKVPGANSGSLWPGAAMYIMIASEDLESDGIQGVIEWAKMDEVLKFINQSERIRVDRPNPMPGTEDSKFF